MAHQGYSSASTCVERLEAFPCCIDFLLLGTAQPVYEGYQQAEAISLKSCLKLSYAETIRADNYIKLSFDSCSRLQVEIDLDLNAHANARVHFETRRGKATKQQKTLEQNEKALRAAEKTAQQKLTQVSFELRVTLPQSGPSISSICAHSSINRLCFLHILEAS